MILELIKKLRKCYPKGYISISIEFDSFENGIIHQTFYLFVDGVGKTFRSLPDLINFIEENISKDQKITADYLISLGGFHTLEKKK